MRAWACRNSLRTKFLTRWGPERLKARLYAHIQRIVLSVLRLRGRLQALRTIRRLQCSLLLGGLRLRRSERLRSWPVYVGLFVCSFPHGRVVGERPSYARLSVGCLANGILQTYATSTLGPPAAGSGSATATGWWTFDYGHTNANRLLDVNAAPSYIWRSTLWITDGISLPSILALAATESYLKFGRMSHVSTVPQRSGSFRHETRACVMTCREELACYDKFHDMS